MQPANELDRIKLRRYENILIVSGMGVIAFALWSIVRTAIFFITQPYDIVEMMGMQDDLAEEAAVYGEDVAHALMTGATLAAVFFVLVVDVLARVYIGRSAFNEGRAKKKKSPVYIVLAIIMAIGLIWTLTADIIYTALGMETAEGIRELDTASASNILNITSLLALVELVISAIRVRKLRKQLGIRIGKNGIIPIEEGQSGTEAEMMDTGMFDTGVPELNTTMHEAAGDLSAIVKESGLGD